MQYPVSSVKLCCASNDFTILFHLGLDLARPLNAINSNYFQLKPETDLDSTFDQLPAENLWKDFGAVAFLVSLH